MKREEAAKLTEAGVQELALQLQSGKTQEFESYLSTMSSFHDYSWGNIMLITRQSPNATLVAGFRTWQNKHNRNVKKGEKGICILAPMIGKKKDAKSGEEDEEKSVFGYRAVHVFDVSQTEGEDLPAPHEVSGEPGANLERLKQVARDSGITLYYEEDLRGADGLSKGGAIALRANLSPAEEFSTLAHELCHELLHRKEERSATDTRQRELEAESVAFVVAKACGIENALNHSADYILSYDGDTELLTKSLARIQKMATTLITSLRELPQEEEPMPKVLPHETHATLTPQELPF